jgi:hypothetical protein
VSAAISQDAAVNGTFNRDSVERLKLETVNLVTVQGMLDRIRPAADRITPVISNTIHAIMQDASNNGTINTAAVDRVYQELGV